MTKITPKQAFDALRIVWPGLTKIQKYRQPDGSVNNLYPIYIQLFGKEFPLWESVRSGNIDWGDIDVYEEKWFRPVTAEDLTKAFKGNFPRARFRLDGESDWILGSLVGFSPAQSSPHRLYWVRRFGSERLECTYNCEVECE